MSFMHWSSGLNFDYFTYEMAVAGGLDVEIIFFFCRSGQHGEICVYTLQFSDLNGRVELQVGGSRTTRNGVNFYY